MQSFILIRNILLITFQDASTGFVGGDHSNKSGAVNQPSSSKEYNGDMKRRSRQLFQKYVTTDTAKEPLSQNVSTGSTLASTAETSTKTRHITATQISTTGSEVHKYLTKGL